MDTIFSLKPKKSIKAVIDNRAMMRLKMQNALIQQELNRVKAANAALALAAQQQSEHETKVALHAQQREHEAKLALEAHLQQQQREHEARVALEAHRQQQQQQQQHHQHQHHQQEAPVAPQIKKSKFGKLLSNMNKLN